MQKEYGTYQAENTQVGSGIYPEGTGRSMHGIFAYDTAIRAENQRHQQSGWDIVTLYSTRP